MKLFNLNTEDLKPKFSNIVEKFWGGNMNSLNVNHSKPVPSVNIKDAKKSFELNIAVPGIDKKDIQLELDHDCLVVSSRKEGLTENRDNYCIRQEYSYSSFRRVFELPESVDRSKIQASLRNGILKITVAKNKRFLKLYKKKRINIK